jgi:hypothetical protein
MRALDNRRGAKQKVIMFKLLSGYETNLGQFNDTPHPRRRFRLPPDTKLPHDRWGGIAVGEWF